MVKLDYMMLNPNNNCSNLINGVFYAFYFNQMELFYIVVQRIKQ